MRKRSAALCVAALMLLNLHTWYNCDMVQDGSWGQTREKENSAKPQFREKYQHRDDDIDVRRSFLLDESGRNKFGSIRATVFESLQRTATNGFVESLTQQNILEDKALLRGSSRGCNITIAYSILVHGSPKGAIYRQTGLMRD